MLRLRPPPARRNCLAEPVQALTRSICAIVVGTVQAQTDAAKLSVHAATAKHLNIVVILTDDIGHSGIGSFGSGIPTPNLKTRYFQQKRARVKLPH